MRLLKQALGVSAALVVLAVTAAFIAPERVHAVVAALVQVENTPAQSIPTWRTDNDGRNVVRLIYSENMAVGVSFSAGTGNGVPLNDSTTNSVYTVPVGNRLVIDTVSIFAYPPSGQQVFAYFNNGRTYTGIPAIDAGNFSGVEDFQNAIPVRDYVEPGGQYSVTMLRSGATGSMFWDANVVGHLVDCTNGGGC